EINVACESCHGPAAEHLKVLQEDSLSAENTGFALSSGARPNWALGEGDAIARASSSASSGQGKEIDMCGGCHALRTVIGDVQPAGNFHDQYRLNLLDNISYFPDGQIREEVFVLGSFLQSKMHVKGVTCSNCHDPHSGQLVEEGNALCAQCHRPEVFDAPGHHHHPPESAGAQCVNCHMPSRAFMVIDERRDHSFTIPRPDLSIALGVPNACTGCHDDRAGDNSWALDVLKKWGYEPDDGHVAYLQARLGIPDILATRRADEVLEDVGLAPIVRASLLAQLAAIPSRLGAEQAAKNLSSPSPMVRRAAVQALRPFPAELRWKLLAPMLDDPGASVRYALAETVLDIPRAIVAEKKNEVQRLLEEYRDMLNASADAPGTQVALANLAIRERDVAGAREAYERALSIAPNYVPVLLSAAEFYRSTGDVKKEAEYLAHAVRIDKGNAAALHSYGLHLVRKKMYESALPYLQQSTSADGAVVRYAFVYAIALKEQGKLEQAIAVLEEADERWPNQYDILMTLVSLAEESGGEHAVGKYVSRLSQIAPGSPEVKKLVQRYIESARE
ncbi:MAG: cytochrome c3 family protein, partial [Pseudomonadales bacterium]